MPNYNYVIDSSFQPFSLQEMLVPFTAYKEAYDKQEAINDALSEKLGDFDYLKDYAEDSQARKIYEGYANDYQKQLDDFSRNGLYAGNRRALTSLKRRFTGEIGRLKKAEEALQEEKKLRRNMDAQDSSILRATDNLSLDDFLDNKNPNLYSISGDKLYARGAAASKAASSRVFNTDEGASILKGYYIDYVQKNGYSPETINAFLNDMATIPEMQKAVDNILEGTGVNQNLTGDNLNKARKQVIQGIVDGAVYNESHSPQKDLSKIDAATAAHIAVQREGQALQREAQELNLKMNGYTYDRRTKELTYDEDKDMTLKRDLATGLASGKYITDENGNVALNPAYKKSASSGTSDVNKTEYEELKPNVTVSANGDYTQVSGNSNFTRGQLVAYDDLTDDEKSRIETYHPEYMRNYDIYRKSDGSLTIVNTKKKVPRTGTVTAPQNSGNRVKKH